MTIHKIYSPVTFEIPNPNTELHWNWFFLIPHNHKMSFKTLCVSSKGGYVYFSRNNSRNSFEVELGYDF